MTPKDFLMMFSWKDFHGHLTTNGWFLDLNRLEYFRKEDSTRISERTFETLWSNLRFELYKNIYSPKELDWFQMFDNLITRGVDERV